MVISKAIEYVCFVLRVSISTLLVEKFICKIANELMDLHFFIVISH